MKNSKIIIILLLVIAAILIYTQFVPKAKQDIALAKYKEKQEENERKSIIGDLNNLASSSLAFYKTPVKHGGGGNSWTTDIDNIGNWLGYNYLSSSKTLSASGNTYYLYFSNKELTIEATGTRIGSDKKNPVKVKINITGASSKIETKIIN